MRLFKAGVWYRALGSGWKRCRLWPTLGILLRRMPAPERGFWSVCVAGASSELSFEISPGSETTGDGGKSSEDSDTTFAEAELARRGRGRLL